MSTTEQDEWKTFAAVIRDDPRAAQLQMLVEGALAEGRRQGWSDAALEVLDARHIAVSDEIRDHILGCGDTDMLRLWVRRSVTATTAAATALFDEPKLSAGVGDLERAGGRDLRPGGPSAGRPTDSSMPPTQLPRRARL